MQQVIEDTYEACLNSQCTMHNVQLKTASESREDNNELSKANYELENFVRLIYAPFTAEEINAKMVEMLRPQGLEAPIELVFQSIEGLHTACPNHHGDWYFTGHYPTPGGIRRVNEAFVDYIRNNKPELIKS